MPKEMDRRQFIKTMAGGAVGAAGLHILGGIPLAQAEQKQPAVPGFEGKPKFAGVHNVRHISDDLVYLGASDSRLELFENAYPIPRGVSYNAYLLLDEKTALLDTVDRSVSGQFFENLIFALKGRPLDYLIINHMEPDHCSAISEVMTRWPRVQLICSKAAQPMIKQFFGFDPADHGYLVGEGDSMSTGRHQLHFVMAPMVHWPEVMMTYDATDKILFSADAFGSFGALGGNLFADEVNFESDWLPDARRYYTNIVGKYGPQVQDALKKAGTIDIRMLCPLHGPVWRDQLGWFLDKYDRWSRYAPEDEAVMVVYGSIYGGTESAARLLASSNMLRLLRQPSMLLDLFILLTLLAPQWLENFGFLRILRLWSLSHKGIVWAQFRETRFREWENVVRALSNIATFLFVVTGFVYTFFFRHEGGLESYVQALYFTVATVTTTGFGDVTLPGVAGKLTSIVVMIVGITLFVRLAQALFRPNKVLFPCPECALQRHEPDAVYCKACGHKLKIPDDDP